MAPYHTVFIAGRDLKTHTHTPDQLSVFSLLSPETQSYKNSVTLPPMNVGQKTLRPEGLVLFSGAKKNLSNSLLGPQFIATKLYPLSHSHTFTQLVIKKKNKTSFSCLVGSLYTKLLHCVKLK